MPQISNDATKDQPKSSPNLHNRIVEFLTSLPNIQDKNERRALIYSAALDKELETQIEFEGTIAQFCQLLVNTFERYGTLKDGRHALVAMLELAKNRVGQEGKVLCDKLIQEVQAAEHLVSKMSADDSDNPTEPKIDIHLKELREVDEVTGLETDEAPEGSTKVTIEDVKKSKKVIGMSIKNMKV